MKNYSKILVLGLIVTSVFFFSSCNKNEELSELQKTEINFFRIETVSKVGDTTYSVVKKIEIK